MRLGGLKGHNVGGFEDFDIDLDAIPGQVVAVTGITGAGKSSFLELMSGGLPFRACESRGTLASLVTGPGAFIEGRVTAKGATYTIRHDLAGKGESFVWDGDDRRPETSLLESPKVSVFDEWAKKHLPSSSVLYASTVAVQKGEGFIQLSRGDRMKLLIRALGADRLERQAEAARVEARAADKRVGVNAALLSAEKDRAVNVETADEAAAKAQLEVSGAEQVVQEASAALKAAREEFERVTLLNVESERQRAELAAAQAAVTSAREAAEGLAQKMVSHREMLRQSEAITAAVARVAEIDALVSKLTVQNAQHRADEDSARREGRLHVERSQAADKRVQKATDQARFAEKRLARRAEIEKAAADVEAMRVRVAELGREWEAAIDAQHALAGRQLASADDRIMALRDGLIEIRDHGDHPVMGIARETLEADDEAVTIASRQPAELAAAKANADRIHRDKNTATLTLAQTEKVASLAPDIAAASADLVAATTAIAEAEEESAREILASKTSAGRALAIREQIDEAVAQLETLRRERESQWTFASFEGKLRDASARLADLEPEHAASVKAHEEASQRLASASAVAIAPAAPLPAVDLCERRLRDDERSLADARTRLALAERNLEQANASAARIAELEASLAQDREHHAEWTRVANDVDGVKLMEIDAAGPQLTADTNQLLHDCFGPRFTVTIDTQRADTDGKRMIDGVDVRVIDSERGREADAKSLSGGERVIIDEAISLALAILYCRRSGARDVTLVRDETGSALDPIVHGPEYVAMLRRAASIVGASKVLVVSHFREIQELADAHIDIRNRRIAARTEMAYAA